jgi:flavin reductase (DIM6/NTAB) family NADH-FMN oxidoreductase RutF
MDLSSKLPEKLKLAENLSAEQLRKVLGHFATGVTVVTTRLASGQPWGFTVNAFTSVSLTPPLILICVGHRSESFQAMSQAQYFAVNFLAEDQEEIARVFASKTRDRFEQAAYRDSSQGNPLLDGCLGYLECRKAASHAHGDHTILIGEVLAAEARGGTPLLFYRSAFGRVEPAKAAVSD